MVIVKEEAEAVVPEEPALIPNISKKEEVAVAAAGPTTSTKAIIMLEGQITLNK